MAFDRIKGFRYAPSEMKALIPILPSKDIPASLEFYARVYGFQQPWAWTRKTERVTDLAVHDPKDIGYGGLDAPHEIHFWYSDDKHVLESAGLRIETEDIQTLYAACQAANCVHPNAALATKPWGVKEFGTLDPSGVLVTFFQTL